jgi:hypothetical protein
MFRPSFSVRPSFILYSLCSSLPSFLTSFLYSFLLPSHHHPGFLPTSLIVLLHSLVTYPHTFSPSFLHVRQ